MSSDDALAVIQDELALLTEIMGPECVTVLGGSRGVELQAAPQPLPATMIVHFPAGYPGVAPSVHIICDWATPAQLKQANGQLAEIMEVAVGEPVVYQLLTAVQDAVSAWAKAYVPTAAGPSSGAAEAAESDTAETREREEAEAAARESAMKARALALQELCPEIVHGDSVVDRKSVFQAHVAAVSSPEQVKAFMAVLCSDRKIARATHNIMAYRIVKPSGAIIQDNDEDGEDGAGSRLTHLLEVMKVTGAVVCVSRWYGGIQLGPDRFKHISNCARVLLEAAGLAAARHSD